MAIDTKLKHSKMVYSNGKMRLINKMQQAMQNNIQTIGDPRTAFGTIQGQNAARAFGQNRIDSGYRNVEYQNTHSLLRMDNEQSF